MESDNMKKALIAMSGGVDSSVAAYLMKEHGYDCIGVTMKLFQNEDAGVSRKKSCCSLDDVEDARSVAHNLGIPYYVFNFTADFKKQVMDRFVAAYENGATPNPCIDCNRYLKFNSLYHRAEELGCHYVVTGHYARIEQREDGRYLLKKAAEKHYPTKLKEYLNPWVITAYSIFLVSTILTMLALRTVPLSMQPILESTSYIYVSVMGYFLLKEQFTRKKAAGIAVILLGIFIYSLKF